ncbi:MAG: rRNA maturation RNase YbeY [Planctomycetes bacterium]|nr:rRNA maturation RNase YbeY [Planctomycetota bacterium]
MKLSGHMTTLNATADPGSNSAGDSESPTEPAEPSEPPPDPSGEPAPAAPGPSGPLAGHGREATSGPIIVSMPEEDVQRSEPVDPAWLATNLARAVEALGRPVERVGVLLVDDTRMTDLHRRYLGDARTTDVLTFLASESDAPIDADIAVCLDVAAREAVRQGHPVGHEVLLYALHGVLHCAGYDDHDPEAFAAMHAEEDRILAAIGIGATFRAGEGDEP